MGGRFGVLIWAYCEREILRGCTKHRPGACSGTAGGILTDESDKYGDTVSGYDLREFIDR